MPRVFEGLFRALIVILFTLFTASLVSIVIFWIQFTSDLIDSASTSISGLPARDSFVSRSVEPALAAAAVVGFIAPLGVLAVYFIHRRRR